MPAPRWPQHDIVRRARDIPAEDALKRDLHPLLARIYAGRGVHSARQAAPPLSDLLPPDTLSGARAAAVLLADVIGAGGDILIVGDYDADGATAAALMEDTLRTCGASVAHLVPDRFEHGYGLSVALAKVALQRRPALLVTVDNGISSIEGVALVRAAGVEVLVTDHHLPGEQLPDASVIVDPNLPGSDFGSRALAGVGVAFYVLLALRAELRQRGWFAARGLREPNLRLGLDLVALGTVADVVPMDANNRILVREGLRLMRGERARPGIAALLQVARRDPADLTADDLGFTIGPRLNAAGRLADMDIGIRCLLAPDLDTALPLAQQLDALNRERRELQVDMTAGAMRALASPDDKTTRASVCVFDAGWHQGVVGTVAGRLREHFNCPAIAFAPATGELLRGSARSVPGFNIRDALASVAAAYPGLVPAFGGHAMAAGVTLTRARLEPFRAAFERICRAQLGPVPAVPVHVTDGDLPPEWMAPQVAELVMTAGPFGAGFAPPLFDGVFEVVSTRTFGNRNQHCSMVLTHYAGVVDAVAFNRPAPVRGTRVQLVYRLGIDRYRGVATTRLIVEHLQAAPGPGAALA